MTDGVPADMMLDIFEHLQRPGTQIARVQDCGHTDTALVSLSLTSKRFSALATHLLHSSVIYERPLDADISGFMKLLRTIVLDTQLDRHAAHIEHLTTAQCHDCSIVK
jgi:hypothetical protein